MFLYENPLVSICCVTYNHEKYIEDAIQGFLSQKTSFPYEILIHDDASTDSTAKIIRKYQVKYPKRVFPFIQNENQYSKGVKVSPILFKRARGKYIAWCEGDDYWIDSEKLQKQVSFLEENPEYVLCFHNILWFWQDSEREPEIREKSPKDTYTLENHIKPDERATVGHTSTAVFLRTLTENLPEWFYNAVYEDVPLFAYIGGFGLTKYINEVMAVHRIYPDSLSSKKKNLKFLMNKLRMYKAIDKHYRYQYHNLLKEKLSYYYQKILYNYRDQLSKIELIKALFGIILNDLSTSNPLFSRIKCMINNKK